MSDHVPITESELQVLEEYAGTEGALTKEDYVKLIHEIRYERRIMALFIHEHLEYEVKKMERFRTMNNYLQTCNQ